MKILLDLDGVLADFITRWLKFHGKPMPDPWPEGIWDVAEIFGIKPDIAYGDLSDLWWSSLAKTPDADAIMEIATTYTNDIYIISAPQLGSGATGKIKWINQHFPDLKDRFILTKHKELLASEEHILLDDYEANIDCFNQNGGRGILVPRVWNRLHNQETIPYLKVAVENCVEAINAGAYELSHKPWRG